jgi:hypothetical protein
VAGCSLLAATASAVAPSEKLLPNTTAAWLSVPDVDALRAEWKKTQIGQMIDDPIMKPFVEDLRKQLTSKISKTGVKLGITWDDLDGVYGGEVSIAAVQPNNDPKQHALALLVDTTGKEAQLDALLKKVVKSQKDKGGKVTGLKIDGVDVTDIQLAKDVKGVADHAFYAVVDKQLLVADNLSVITALIGQTKKPNDKVLANVEAYKVSLKNVAAAQGEIKPHAKWYVEPFRYVEVSRAMSTAKRKRGQDVLKVLRNQGFDAVKGVAGNVTLMTKDHDLLHNTFVYAPQDAKAVGDDKYRLGMRMVDLPNKPTHEIPKWVPADCGAYLSLNWKMKDAFSKYLGSVVNEFAEDEIFEELIESLATDPAGPMFHLRKDLFDHLGERAMLVTDAVEPIDVKSERLLVALELANPKHVEDAINKSLKKDADARMREYKGHIIWEIINEQQAKVEFQELMIDGPVGVPVVVDEAALAAPEKKEDEKEERVLPNSAITVYDGYLIVASHADYIEKLLDGQENALDKSDDFNRISTSLDKLGAGKQAARHFVRTDKAFRTTYELIRQGKMPEAETVLGRVLNRLLADEDEEELREQLVDGKKMPEFGEVKKYFGPAGMFITTEKEGWMVTGCVLHK